MGIDADDIKILIHISLQYIMKSCCQCAKDHPLVSGVVVLLFPFYIFLPSFLNILFYFLPFAICAAIYLGGQLSFGPQNINNLKKDDAWSDEMSTQNSKARSSIEKPKSVRRYEKGENKENEVKVFDKEKGVSKATSKDDFVHQCLMGGMPMKIQKEKNVNYASDHSEGLSLDVVDSMEVEKSEASIHRISQPDCPYPNSEQSRKFIGDISESNTKFQEHREDDVPQEETNKAVHCTDNDQGNHMDLGTSEIERNRRLESLITKRRLRKLLSMDPRRNHIYLYSHNSQAQDRAVVDIEFQPGSAPSVLLPTRNPFDLPYDSSEEKPILTGGSFMDEFFNSQQKDISFCRHASFVRGHGFMGDLNEFPLSFPGLLTKPITSEGPGLYGFRRPSDMEQNEQLFTRMLSQQAELNQIQSVSYHQTSTLPPEEEKQRKLVELDFSHDGIPILLMDSTEYNADQLGHKEGNLVETNKEEDAETKDKEQDSVLDLNVQANTHTTDEAVMKLDIVGETFDETISQSSSEASEDIIYADKNESFRNSVRKVLTCLTQKNKGLANEKIDLPNNPLYGTSPTAIHPTNMEEHSLYMGRPFHTPTYSIASDMHVNVSEAGSPSFNAEANSPTDRELFVYYGDVDKDISSDDEDFWGASSHLVGFEEFGSRLRVDETWEMDKSLLGLPTHTSYDPPNSSGKLANVVEQAIHDASSRSPRSMLQKERCLELMDFVHKIDNLDHQVITGGTDSRSSVSSSSERLIDQGKPEQFSDNLVALPVGDLGSITTEEHEPSSEESHKMIWQEATTLEAINLADKVHHSITNWIQKRSLSFDDSQVQQGGTKDGDLVYRQSNLNSVSPAIQLKSVVEQVPINLSSFSKSVLQEVVTIDAVAPTNGEQNVHIDIQHSGGAVGKINSLNDLQQENDTVLDEENHLEDLTKRPSVEGATSVEKAATEVNINLKELQANKEEAEVGKSIEDGGSISTFTRKIAGNAPMRVEEIIAKLDVDTECEAKVQSPCLITEDDYLHVNDAPSSVENGTTCDENETAIKGSEEG